ncbi:MAG: response regulator [Planctomycetaceae bacterium]|nr:response regulator [Planctomycetaceae bacterium]
MTGSQKILLIEDDREISSTLSGVLRGAGYDVVTAPNGIEGQKLIQDEKPALVITDMMMPRMGGFPVLDFINTLDRKPAVIMITANEGGRHKAYAEMLGVVDYLRKPFPMEMLLDAVSRALNAPPPKPGAAQAAANDDADQPDDAPLGPLRRSRSKKKTDG